MMRMSHRPVHQRLRFLLSGLMAVGVGASLGGCAGGTIDACPYVRNENPSLLQGRMTSQSEADSSPNHALPKPDSATGVAASF